MKKRCILRAPAKLNLHLQIGEKRRDGFHDINSLFVMVDLYDEIDAGSLKTGNDCRIIGDFNCANEDNLIYRAWSVFCEKAGKSYGVEFRVVKKIPSFAGLGGGSSDAAAALRILNLLCETGFNDDELADMGSRIGSDVPFFIKYPAAVIGGRGEKIKGIEAEKLDFILLQPDVEVSTKEAYGWVDENRKDVPPFMSQERIIEIYRGKEEEWRHFGNDFSAALKNRYDIFLQMEKSLNDLGAVFCSVTGSGSAVFGLFKSSSDAENAEKTLQNRYKFVQKIKSLDRIPNAILK